MKWLRGHIFVTVFSLLCLAATGLWVRSEFHRDELRFGGEVIIASEKGQIFIRPMESDYDWDIPYYAMYMVTILAYIFHREYLLKKERRVRIAGAKGLCAKCGYDLRASKDRCPECGTKF